MPNKPKGRPTLKNPNVINKGFKTNAETIKKANEYAKKHNLTFSKVVQKALEKLLDEK